MEMLEYTAEVLIRSGRAARPADEARGRRDVPLFDAHVDDILFCASAAPPPARRVNAANPAASPLSARVPDRMFRMVFSP